MNKFLRIFSALCALMLILSLFSCASRPIKSSAEEAEIVATCDGHEIPFEQIRYLAVSHKALMAEQYGADIWEMSPVDPAYLDELRSRVEDDIKTYSTVLSVSRNHNVNIDDKEIQYAVQEEIDYVVNEIYGSRTEYKKALASDAMTDSFFRFMYGIYYCQNELYVIMTDGTGAISAPTDTEELYDLLTDELYRTTHVYIPFNYGGNDKEANRQKAEEIYADLISGEITFEEAQFKGGTDTSLSSNGYYFTKGYAEKAYEDASVSLSVGGISEIVELGGAFYIIKRLELDTAYVMGNLYTLRTQYIQTKFNNLLNEYKENLSVSYLKDIDLADIK